MALFISILSHVYSLRTTHMYSCLFGLPLGVIDRLYQKDKTNTKNHTVIGILSCRFDQKLGIK